MEWKNIIKVISICSFHKIDRELLSMQVPNIMWYLMIRECTYG